MIREDFPLSAGKSEEDQQNAIKNLALFSKQLHRFSPFNQ
jgi:hypothetical protein